LPALKQFKTAQEKMTYILKTAAGGLKINQSAAKTFAGQMEV
jgi:hypothetical protein